MRSILVGAVDSTRVALEALSEHGAPPTALFTLPLERSSRHSDYVDLRPLAKKYGVPVVDILNVNRPEVLERIADIQTDYSFVVGWSQICHPPFLSMAKNGSIGYHPAPLPENRGRAVIPWTILQRRTETGATLFWMDEGMDSGDILVQKRFAVAPDETAATLYRKHMEALGEMFAEAIPSLQSGTPPRIAQDHSGASYCARRGPEDGMVNWNAPAQEVDVLIRAVGEPYPGAFTFYKGRRVVLWDVELVGAAPYWGLPGQVQLLTPEGALVQCGDGGHVRLKTVQFEGEEKTSASQAFKIHDKLGIDLMEIWRRLQSEPG